MAETTGREMWTARPWFARLIRVGVVVVPGVVGFGVVVFEIAAQLIEADVIAGRGRGEPRRQRQLAELIGVAVELQTGVAEIVERDREDDGAVDGQVDRGAAAVPRRW